MKLFFRLLLFVILLLAAMVFLLETFSSYTSSTSIHTNAPVKTFQSIIIHAPVENVYALFTDINKWPSWQQEITAAKLNGALQPGSTIDWKTGGLSIHSTLQTVLTDSIVGWSGKAFGAFAIHVWHFEPHNDYTTVTVNESMEGWLVSLMTGYFQRHLEPATKYWLEALKIEAEKN